MNVINNLTDRIESYRKETKNPCKNYATKENAEKATAKMAERSIIGFGCDKSANYIVFYIEAWGRWVGAIDINEMMRRPDCEGGYLGAFTGFYTY